MVILVDSREPSDVIDLLRRDWPALTVMALQSGDFSAPLPTGLLLIERKTVSDLLGSIADGRLFTQAQALAQNARWPLLVIHGSLLYNHDDMVIADGKETRWRGLSVRNALRACQWAGCPIEYAGSAKYDYNRCIKEAIALATKPDHAHYDRQKTRKPPIDFFPHATAKRERIEFIAGMPGIGPTRARALIEWVDNDNGEGGKGDSGSPAEALEYITGLATFPNFERPPDWGTVSINAVRQFLGLPQGYYLKVTPIQTPEELLAEAQRATAARTALAALKAAKDTPSKPSSPTSPLDSPAAPEMASPWMDEDEPSDTEIAEALADNQPLSKAKPGKAHKAHAKKQTDKSKRAAQPKSSAKGRAANRGRN